MKVILASNDYLLVASNDYLLVVVLVMEVHSVAVVTSGALMPFCNGQHKYAMSSEKRRKVKFRDE